MKKMAEIEEKSGIFGELRNGIQGVEVSVCFFDNNENNWSKNAKNRSNVTRRFDGDDWLIG